jgi:uncharacterized protein YjbI with pentapeptide repeats
MGYRSRLIAALRPSRKQGIASWNNWRLISPTHDVSGADLSGADLRDAKLSGADLHIGILRGANLTHADLRDAKLTYADLRYADLSHADLSGANLNVANVANADLSGANLRGANLRHGANLSDAYLSRADLSYADLRGANLSRANLSGVDLSHANLRAVILNSTILNGTILTEAYLRDTVFAAVDLTNVVGLADCTHGGSSKIDYRTLQRSGSLSIEFLRGVGLPESLIEYLPALLSQAIQRYSCFISFSSKDEEFAKRIHADLQDKGIRCWFVPHDLPIGAKIWDAIDEAIKLRDKLLLILSKNSIESDWVEDEVQKAFAEERERKQLVLLPVRIDDVVMETPEPWARKLRDQRNIGDFRRWKDHDAYWQSFERVVRDLAIPPKVS